MQAGLHEDSDLTQVRNELELANKVLQDIAEVESGNTTNQEVLAALQEVSMVIQLIHTFNVLLGFLLLSL